MVTWPVLVYSCSPGGSWMQLTWRRWVLQMPSNLSWFSSRMPMVSLAALKWSRVSSMRRSVSCAAATVSSHLLQRDPAPSTGSLFCLLGLLQQLHILPVPNKDGGGESAHEVAVQGVALRDHHRCQPPHEMADVQPHCKRCPLCEQVCCS